VVIDDCLLIEDNDMLFISGGEKFIHPSTPAYKNSLKSDMPNLIGSYRVRKLLGRGGFGEVRVGQHIITSETVALKFIRKQDISDIDAVDRTNNEIQCLLTLHHKNIIALAEVSVHLYNLRSVHTILIGFLLLCSI
jgi:serine/threonine protein kinase